MLQRNHRASTSKYARHLLLIVGGVLVILSVVIGGTLLVVHAIKTPSNLAQSTPNHSVTVPVTTIAVATSTSTNAAQPTRLIPVEVSAYTIEGPMADGKQTHVGACAVSRVQFPLGTILYLYNADGTFNRQCIAEDTGNFIHVGQIDVAMPGDTVGAVRWGIRHLWARVARWGWGTGGTPTPLPTP